MELLLKTINIYLLYCNEIILIYEWIIKGIMMRIKMWEKYYQESNNIVKS